MVTSSDSFNTADLGRYYAILPTAWRVDLETYCRENGGRPVPPGFAYNSGNNEHFLDAATLRTLIREHVEPDFACE